MNRKTIWVFGMLILLLAGTGVRGQRSPDGKEIAYIGNDKSPAQSDIFIMPSNGGPPQPLQVTLLTKELSLDWR